MRLLEAVDGAGLDGLIFSVRRHDGVEAEGGFFELFPVGLDVGSQLHTEIVEGKFVERNRLVEVFEVEHLVLESKQLLVAVVQVFRNQLAQVFRLQDVVFGGAMSTSAMRASTRFFRLMYLLRSGVGQKLMSWISLFWLPIRSIRPKR
jgi:hypothetical protein